MGDKEQKERKEITEMKKFLSILLALAVGFTFTFGSAMSAFAATPVPGAESSYQEKLDYASEELAKELLSAKTATKEALADKYTEKQKYTKKVNNVDTEVEVEFTVNKSVYEKIAEDIYADYANVLTIAKNQLEKAFAEADESGKATLTAQSIADIKASLKTEAVANGVEKYAGLSINNVIDTVNFTKYTLSTDNVTAYKQKTLYYAFDDVKKENIAELEKVDLTLYTDDVIDEENDAYKTTYAQLADTAKKELIADAKKVVIQDNTTAEKIAEAIASLQTMVSAKTAVVKSVTNIDGTTTVINRKLTGVTLTAGGKALLTKDELKNADTSLAALKEDAKATVQNRAATYYKNALTEYNFDKDKKAKFEKATKEKDAYITVQNALIDAATTGPISVAPFTFTSLDAVTTTYTDLVELYNVAAAYADQCKKAVEKDGSLTYNAAIIDKNLEAVQIAIYEGTCTTGVEAKAAVIVDAKNIVADLEFAKANKIAILEDARDGILYEKDGTDKYYAAEKEELTKRYAEVIDKVNAATSVEQVSQISTTVVISDINNKDQVALAIQTLSKWTTEKTKVYNYLGYVNTGLNSWDDGYRALDEKTLATFYAEKGARTNAEIEALLADAKAMVDALPTKKEFADSKAAVKALIAALPNTITLADKAAVKAAYDAEVELGVNADNHVRLQNAIATVKTLEADAIDKMIKALPELSKITTANKDAVKAVADAIEEYNTTMMYDDTYSTVKLVQYQNAVRDAAANEVIAAIAALNDNSTKADVEAARAKYDEFVKEYTDALNGYNPVTVISAVNGDKLTVLEAKFAELEKFTDADAKAYVFDQTIKATSAKLSAKKVKVTANFDASKLVENGYTVEYKFYKSTKKSSGYKYTGVTKVEDAKTYTNTNAKKGKNYYKFKVVVKNADGTVILTTALKDCKYACRTIK